MSDVGRYDRFFGGKGSAEKVLSNMKRTYGAKKGETVFEATVTKRQHKQRKQRRTRWLQGS